MQEFLEKKYWPGQKICRWEPQNKNQVLGYGLYSKNGYTYASAFGILSVKYINTQKQKKTIYEITNNLPTKKVGIEIGDIVYSRVSKVKEDECLVSILQINDTPVSLPTDNGKTQSIEGSIRKQNVRQKMTDAVSMLDCFKPTDLVKAKVISLGDSIRSVYLSTASQDLGVILAINQQTQRIMLPFDWQTMIDPEQMLKQGRKVCRPDFS